MKIILTERQVINISEQGSADLNADRRDREILSKAPIAQKSTPIKKQLSAKNIKIKKIQQKLISLGYLPKGQDDGFWGPKTDAAWINFKQKKKVPLQPENDNGFILVFAFPDYQPSAGSSWFNTNVLGPVTRALYGGSSSSSKGGNVKMGKMGHGGCVIIESNGNSTLFEFGRYNPELEKKGYGVVIKKPLGKIAKIKNGELLNAKQIATIAKSKTQGEGPKLNMVVDVIPIPAVSKAIAYADIEGKKEYTTLDIGPGGGINCGSYALEAAISGGAKTSFVCLRSPIQIVNHLKDISTEQISV